MVHNDQTVFLHFNILRWPSFHKNQYAIWATFFFHLIQLVLNLSDHQSKLCHGLLNLPDAQQKSQVIQLSKYREQRFSNLSAFTNYPEIWVKCRFWLRRSRCGLSICISNELPSGDAPVWDSHIGHRSP